MVMIVLLCVGLLVVFLFVIFYIECSVNVFFVFRDVKLSMSVSKVVMELCFVCRYLVVFGFWNLFGLGRMIGLNGSYRSEDKSRCWFEIVL